MKKKNKTTTLLEILYIFITVSVISFILYLTSYYSIKMISVNNTTGHKVIDQEELKQLGEKLKNVAMFQTKTSFVGQLTAYVGNCPGCSGKVSCQPRINVLEEGVFFDDLEYGTVRIIASDPTYPCGSIMRFKSEKMGNNDIFAVVMDRGGAIKGNIVDLLVETEEEAETKIGRIKNVEFEVLRYGW